MRRKLEPLGITFDTDNDTEAACRFLEWRMREGDDLDGRVQRGFSELDGFYTFLMGTDKDCCSCAIPSPASRRSWPRPTTTWRSPRSSARWRTCRACATRKVFEPKPEEMYSWKA